jgi:hypothetical protein
VRDGVTGALFSELDAPTLARIVETFEPAAFDTAAIHTHARRWDRERFAQRLVEIVAETATVAVAA